MTPSEAITTAGRQVLRVSRFELTLIVLAIVGCATFLGSNHDLSSGDVLAIYTSALTAVAGVAGARVGATVHNGGSSDGG